MLRSVALTAYMICMYVALTIFFRLAALPPLPTPLPRLCICALTVELQCGLDSYDEARSCLTEVQPDVFDLCSAKY